MMHSSEPGFTPGDARFKALFGKDQGECADHDACHVAQFEVGEILPIKGAHWKVESCEGLTLVLKYQGETKSSQRRLVLKKKARAKKKGRRKR
jgi:hypothetical protein